MWLDWRHADAGVGIGMPALVLVKSDDYGYAKSQKKSVFAVFVFCKKKSKKKKSRKLAAGGFPTTKRRVLGKSIVNSQESKGLLRDSWTQREVLRTNRRTQS